jgi:DNA polymerase delta subunit 1
LLDTPLYNIVYDLETGCGRFQAGVGDIIVKNTDSCMIKLKTLNFDNFVVLSNSLKDKPFITEEEKQKLQELKTKVLEESFEKGRVIAHKITEKLFKKPIELEFEKIYQPYILLSKKRYIGNYYGSSPYKIDKVEQKGIVLSRRDNANIVKKVYTDILNPLLNEGTRGINISIGILRKYINDLLIGKVDINDLLITKTLTKTYGKP